MSYKFKKADSIFGNSIVLSIFSRTGNQWNKACFIEPPSIICAQRVHSKYQWIKACFIKPPSIIYAYLSFLKRCMDSMTWKYVEISLSKIDSPWGISFSLAKIDSPWGISFSFHNFVRIALFEKMLTGLTLRILNFLDVRFDIGHHNLIFQVINFSKLKNKCYKYSILSNTNKFFKNIC